MINIALNHLKLMLLYFHYHFRIIIVANLGFSGKMISPKQWCAFLSMLVLVEFAQACFTEA